MPAPALVDDVAPPPLDHASGHRAFVLGGRVHLGLPDRLGAACYALLAAAILLPLRGLYTATGSTMEEGFMLYFPERMRKGDVPNVDFLHLYGPGSLDALVAWYGLFGHHLGSERTFGLLQHIALIAGIYTLARAWGAVTATVAALVCTLLVITPIELSAMAWEGGVALAVWSVVFANRAWNLAERGERAGRAGGAAGLLAGLALTFRPDLVLALGLVFGWMLWRRRRPAWRPWLGGLVVGLLPLIVHAAVAGPGHSFQGMVLDPVFRLRPGRELPRPPSFSKIDGTLQFIVELQPPWWRLPALRAEKQLFFWFFAMLAAITANLAAAWRTLSRRRNDPRGVALMAGALLGLGVMPQALQRPDSTHLAWVVCISFSLLPVTIVELLAGRAGTDRRRGLVAGGAMAALLLVVCPFYTYRTYLLHVRVSAGNLPSPFQIERDGRQFWMGKFVSARASQEAVDYVGEHMRPGERLLVGPADLSRTVYSDVMFYWLLPELTPATYYIEMDPGLADRADSGLADDVRSADWLILTNFWSGWFEPNASVKHGSPAPNDVVATEFCLVDSGQPDHTFEDGEVLLYHRCAPGEAPWPGVSPAEVGGRSSVVRAAGG